MAIRDRDEALQAMFAAKRAGQGNIYGGPPMPAPQQAPQPQQPQGGGGGYQSLADQMAQQDEAPDTGLNPFSSGFGTSLKNGLGTVLGGAAKKLDWVANAGVLGAEEFSEWVGGDEFETQKNDDGTLNEFGQQGNWEKLNDPEYGFGKLMGNFFGESTAGSVANKALGFVGDVGLDPVTYVGGAILKSPIAVGKAGRQAMSQTAARLNLGDEVVESIAKYGPAFQSDAVRAQLGVKKAGVYWGVGDASFRLPMLNKVGSGSEKFFAKTRVGLMGKYNVSKHGNNRGKAQFATMRKALSTGETIDGITPAAAGRFMNAMDDLQSAAGSVGEGFKREAQAKMSRWDDATRLGVTKEVQSAPLDAAGKIADPALLSPQAQAWVNLRDKIYATAEEAGIDIGDLGGNYFPVRMNKEGFDFLRRFPAADGFHEDLSAPTSAALTRKMKPGTVHKFGDVDVVITADDSIEGIEAAFQKAFAGKGADVPEHFFESNSVNLMERYIGEMSRNIGVARMFQNAIKDGTIRQAIEVSSNEMIATAANTLKNKELAATLKAVMKERMAEIAADEQATFALGKLIGAEMKSVLKSMIKSTGDHGESLRPQLKAANKALEVDDAPGIRKAFDEMRQQAQARADKVVKEIEELETSLAAVDGHPLSGKGSKAQQAEGLADVMDRQLDTLEERLLTLNAEVALAERLDERFGVVMAKQVEMDEVAYSQDGLRDFADFLTDDEFVEHVRPQFMSEAEATVSTPLGRDLEYRLKQGQEWQAAVNDHEVEIQDALYRGEMEGIADDLDKAADDLLRDDGEMETLYALYADARSQVGTDGHVDAELVGELRAWRKSVLAKLSRRETKIADAKDAANELVKLGRARERLADLASQSDRRNVMGPYLEKEMLKATDAIADAEWWLEGHASRVLEAIESTPARKLTAVEKRRVKHLQKKYDAFEAEVFKLKEAKPKYLEMQKTAGEEVSPGNFKPDSVAEARTIIDPAPGGAEERVWRQQLSAKTAEWNEVGRELRELRHQIDGPTEAIKQMHAEAAEAAAGVVALKSELKALNVELADQLADPNIARAADLLTEMQARKTRAGHMRSSASYMRTLRTKPLEGKDAAYSKARLNSMEIRLRMDEHNTIRRTVGMEVVRGDDGTVYYQQAFGEPYIEKIRPQFRTLAELDEDIETFTMANEFWLGQLTPAPTGVSRVGEEITEESIEGVRKFLIEMKKPVDDAEKQWRQAKKQREIDFPNFQAQGHVDDAVPDMMRTESEIIQGLLDAGETITKHERNVLDKAEAATRKKQKALAVKREKARKKMTPLQRLQYDDDEMMRSHQLAERELASIRNQRSSLQEMDSRNSSVFKEGQAAEAEVKRLHKQYKDTKKAYHAGLREYGIDPNRLEGGAKLGAVVRWDKHKQARGRWSEKKALKYTEPQEVRDYARSEWNNDWEAARKAHPKDTSTPNGVPKKDFDDLTVNQAARITGGEVRTTRAGTIIKDPERIKKIKKPELIENASDQQLLEYQQALAVYKSQSQERVVRIIRTMSGRERARVHGDAQDMWRVKGGEAAAAQAKAAQDLADAVRERDGMLALQDALGSRGPSATNAIDDIRNAGPELDKTWARLGREMTDAQAHVVDDSRVAVNQAEKQYEALKGQAERVSQEATDDSTRSVALRQHAVRAKAWKEAEYEQLAAIEARIGKLETEQLAAADAARKVHEDTVASVKKQQAWVVDRKKKLEKLRTGKAEKLRNIGKKDAVTARVLERQGKEMRAILDAIGINPAENPELLAVARLMDDHLSQTIAIESKRAAVKDIGQLMKEAKKGNLVLDVERQLLDGWRVMDNAMFPQHRDMAIDAKFSEMLTTWRASMNEDLEMKWLDEATQIFKSYATATPGFHVRNFMGASFMNFSDGVSTQDSVEGLKRWNAYTKDIDGYLLRDDVPDYVKDAFNAVYIVGAGGSFDPGEIGTGLKRGLKGLQSNAWLRANRKLGEDLVEGPVRLAAALNTTRRLAESGGVTGAAASSLAAARVKRLHFDYSDLSKMDQKIKRFIPYWMFMSRNLPLQVEQMWRKPKAYAVYNHFMNNISVEGDEDEFMPKWMRDSGAVIGMRGSGGGIWGDGSDTAFMPDLQHTSLESDLAAFSNPIDGLLSAGNPFITKPIEIGTNHSGFFGGDLIQDYKKDKYGNSVEKSGGEKNLERAMHALEGFLTPVGYSQGLLGTDVLGGAAAERAGRNQFQKWLNMGGIPLRKVGENERMSEALRRQYEDAD